jgi:hypothetical protein
VTLDVLPSVCPLQEYHAAAFGLPQARANLYIHLLAPILKQCLAKHKPATCEQELQEDKEYLADVTERPIQRDTYEQKLYYSGDRRTEKRTCIP